ncbi:uncharacterized protein LOC106068443 isoform X1 [Biomphalaria glabrata]|uniref:Uncharacterized protein LOC106068443 isoform X1 n=2 Tax=Biomphalaria glabrata TaxID=6526 RepID=A0A9U8ED81_BIOGL|nr:uncharacterized protein LOC106068443 isoform X1 [Biomphalaria glabrata]
MGEGGIWRRVRFQGCLQVVRKYNCFSQDSNSISLDSLCRPLLFFTNWRAMEPGSSTSSQNFSTCEMELLLCDSTLKRGNSDLDASKQERKKRRSSLSCHRRSITRPCSPPVFTEGQVTNNETIENQPAEKVLAEGSLLPNPSNLEMDKVITDMKAEIKKLDQEYEDWASLLAEFEQKETQSKELSMNLSLSMEDIPEDIKEYAMANYIQTKPLDLLAIKNQVDQMLLKAQFDRESCVRDVRLIQQVVQTMQAKNKMMASKLTHVFDQDLPQVLSDDVCRDPKELVCRILKD